MNLKFLKYYIDNKLYIQNPPMNIEKFIKFCKDRGIRINKKELESFEKEGKFFPIFRVKNKFIDALNKYYPINFTYENIEILNSDNCFIIPSEENFKPFKEYYDTETESEKITNYYSSFQIYNLNNILNGIIYPKLNIDLLISIQLFLPYGRSNQRTIIINGEKDYWRKEIESYKLETMLKILNVSIEELIMQYTIICKELPQYLGTEDILQLWKHIKWNKKTKLKGPIRLGIEYLEWSLMLKKCIENYLKREIFDIDECTSFDCEYILNNHPSDESKIRTVRSIRNKKYFDKYENKYEYNLNRKKLFYLSNNLSLDYHPRVLVFVEGETEKIILPKFFEFCGYKIENVMIDIYNIEGISKFYSQEINVRKPDKKYEKVIISNYRELINYFLDNYQTIPYFIGDNENNIINILKEGLIFDSKKIFKEITGTSIKSYEIIFNFLYDDIFKSIKKIANESYEIKNNEIIDNIKEYLNPTKNLNQQLLNDWTHIWNLDFELDNYTDEELANAINEICNLKIKTKEIQKIRYSENKKGINNLNEKISRNKKEINEKLFENLKEHYIETNDKNILNRPIFKVIDRILEISYYNYPPTDTLTKNKNKEKLYENILKGEDRIFIRKE